MKDHISNRKSATVLVKYKFSQKQRLDSRFFLRILIKFSDPPFYHFSIIRPCKILSHEKNDFTFASTPYTYMSTHTCDSIRLQFAYSDYNPPDSKWLNSCRNRCRITGLRIASRTFIPREQRLLHKDSTLRS